MFEDAPDAVVPVAAPRDGRVSLDVSPLTFAIIEFFGTVDTRMMKARWRKYRFKDITPIWGNEKYAVHTFNKPANVEVWPRFALEMSSREADWYHLSGHHGAQFVSDYLPDWEDNPGRNYNALKETGFFNNTYHHGPWSQASQAHPDRGKSDADLYMTMTTPRPTVIFAGSNPLLTKKQPKCRGLLLVGCNALPYRKVRLVLHEHFPNAVVIGSMGRGSGGKKSITPILKVCHKGFFLEPKAIPGGDLCKKLNREYVFEDIAIMRDGWIFHPTGSGRSLKINEDAHDFSLPE